MIFKKEHPSEHLCSEKSFSLGFIFKRSSLVDHQFLFTPNVLLHWGKPHGRVHLLMAREAGRVNESLPALLALVEFAGSMRLLVLLEVGLPDEGLLADVASISLIASVHVLVPGQAGGVAEALLTHAAGVRPLLVGQVQPLLAPFAVLVLLAQGVVVGLVAGAQLQTDLQV